MDGSEVLCDSLVTNRVTEPAYCHTVDQASLHRLEALMRDRKVFLQHLAFEIRETRLLLCSVLLEWDVNRELVLEICQSGERDASLKSRSFESESSSRSVASSVSGPSSVFNHERAGMVARASNQDEEDAAQGFESDDNQSELSIRGLEQRHQHQHQSSDRRKAHSTRSPQRVASKHHHHQQQRMDRHHHHHTRSVSASESHLAHIQTVCMRLCMDTPTLSQWDAL